MFEKTSKLQGRGGGGRGGNKNGEQIELCFSAQAALEVFSLHVNALVLSLILLHEFQVKLIAGLISFSEDNCFPKGLNSQNG